MAMDQIKSSDLWQNGKALCAQNQFIKGLALMEKAAGYNPAYREPLDHFQLNLYNDLCSGAVAKGDLENPQLWELYQKYKKTSPLNAEHGDTDHAGEPSLYNPRNLPDQPSVKSCYTGPYEGWYNSKSPFKFNSVFAPLHPLKMEPEVEPAADISQPLPKGFHKKALSLLRALLGPIIAILVIQILIYGSIILFNCFGDYMGWLEP